MKSRIAPWSLVVLGLLSLVLSGCVSYQAIKRTTAVTAIRDTDGKVVALVTNETTVTREKLWAGCVIESASRFFGADIASTDTQTQTPHVKIGFGSQVTRITPTSTNQLFAAPASSDFKLGQSVNPLAFGIEDKSSSGYMRLGTNTDATAIVPGVPNDQSK